MYFYLVAEATSGNSPANETQNVILSMGLSTGGAGQPYPSICQANYGQLLGYSPQRCTEQTCAGQFAGL